MSSLYLHLDHQLSDTSLMEAASLGASLHFQIGEGEIIITKLT
jgi:hypothetical protein